MKIIGIRPSSFTGEDKSQISGRNIYLTYPLEKGEQNYRDRYSKKTVKTQLGVVEVKAPRDRNGAYEPQIISTRPRRPICPRHHHGRQKGYSELWIGEHESSKS